MGSRYSKDHQHVYYEKDGQVIIDKDLDDLTPEERELVGRLDTSGHIIFLAVGIIMTIIGIIYIIHQYNRTGDPYPGGPGLLGYILLLIGGSFAGFAIYMRWEPTAQPRSKGLLALSLGTACFAIWLVGSYFWAPLCMACFMPIMGAILVFIGVRVLQGKPVGFSHTFSWARERPQQPPPQAPYTCHPPTQAHRTYPPYPQGPGGYDHPDFLHRDDGVSGGDYQRDGHRKG